MYNILEIKLKILKYNRSAYYIYIIQNVHLFNIL